MCLCERVSLVGAYLFFNEQLLNYAAVHATSSDEVKDEKGREGEKDGENSWLRACPDGGVRFFFGGGRYVHGHSMKKRRKRQLNGLVNKS